MFGDCVPRVPLPNFRRNHGNFTRIGLEMGARYFFLMMFMPKTRKGSPLEMGWCGVRPAKTVQVHLQMCMMPRPKEKKTSPVSPTKAVIYFHMFFRPKFAGTLA